MKPFRVSGHFAMGHNPKQQFTKFFAAENEDQVRERILSDLGSRHGVPRRRIHIAEIVDISDAEELDPIVRHVLKKAGA